jgi:hypothetical protein
MSEQESERTGTEADVDTEDVEGHIKRRSDEAEPSVGEAGLRREGDDDPDVEGHIKR